MFAKMKLGTKISAAFGAVLLITLAIGVNGFLSVGKLGDEALTITEVEFPSLNALAGVRYSMTRIYAFERGLYNRRLMANAEFRDIQFKGLEQFDRKLEESLKKFDEFPRDKEEELFWKDFRKEIDEWFKLHREYVEVAKERYSRSKDVNPADQEIVRMDDKLLDIHDKARLKFNKSEEMLNKLIQDVDNDVVKGSAIIKEDVGFTKKSLVVVIIIGFILTFAMGWLLSRNISDILRSLIAEFGRIKDSTVKGILTERGKPEAINFEFRGIITGLNEILEALIKPLNMSVEYVQRIGRGDIPPRITDEYQGDFNTIKNSINACIDNVNAMAADVAGLGKSALYGKLAYRADASAHHGEFRRIVEGMNKTLDCLVGHIDNIPIPVMILDKEMNIQFLNRNGTDLLGTSLNQLANTKCYNHFRTSDCQTSKCACSRAIQQGIQITGETDAHPRGLNLDIQYTGNPIKDEKGEIIGVLETVIDMTAVRKAQRIADKQARYQSEEVAKLVVNLEKLGKGDTSVDVSQAAHDEDTKVIAENISRINAAISECALAIESMISDTDNLVGAAMEGSLNVRADALKHRGDFRKIIQGINQTLDVVLNPINEAQKSLKSMAGGDLTMFMSGDYRGDHAMMKDALNSSLSSINEILYQVREAAMQVDSGAGQVSDSSQALSQGATEQAASLEEITSSMTQLSSQTRMNAENAGQANKLAMNAREIAETGEGQMNRMIGAMKEINDASQNIAKIIKVIDDIAFQTNLLALNAAVEAARAGRHGKGFAVVAEEVRNLAGRSAKAAKETTELIESSIRKVANGSEIADISAQSLSQIVTSAKKVADLVGEIAVASNEQAQGISQVNQGLTQIDSVTQQNTANAEETASASEELSGQAQYLNQMLSRFKLTGDSAAAGAKNVSRSVRVHRPQARKISGNQPRKAVEDHGWGGGAPAIAQKPEDVISLDDKDFGKY